MQATRLFHLATNLSGVLRDLETAGIRVEIGGDFAKYRAYRAKQTDRGPIYPMFDVASSYVDDTNGFWVCGFNPQGELVHTQAARLLDLQDVSLAAHLDTHRHKYITPDTTPDPDLTYYSGPEGLNTISGRVGYHGEFWLRASGLGGPRSQGATSLLSRILLEVMAGAWDPTFVFAFVPKALAAKGAHLRYGYCHCEAGTWTGPDHQITEEDFMIWMGAKDLANYLSRAPVSVKPGMALPKVQPVKPPETVETPVPARANA